MNVLGRDPRLAQVLVVGVRMMAGVRGFRGRRRRRKLGSLLRVLISEGEGNRVGDVIRVDGRGPGFNASAWIRVMAGAPVSSLIRTQTPILEDPDFGVDAITSVDVTIQPILMEEEMSRMEKDEEEGLRRMLFA